jgi:hypothetical protein
MIEEQRVDTIDDLIRFLNELPNHFVFRGHADTVWKLESTLERSIGGSWSADLAAKFEEHSLNAFRSKYHIYNQNEHTPSSKLSWLSVMQHYGVPTRLLDFTESPYVALYFALETYRPLSGTDLAVYAIDYTAIMEKSLEFIRRNDSQFIETRASVHNHRDVIFEEVVDRFSYDILWITEPLEVNARMDRQSGTFLLSGNREKTIESLLNSSTYDGCHMVKYTISNKLYESVYALLRKMSINAKSIYGDLSGLAKAIRMELQVYTI